MKKKHKDKVDVSPDNKHIGFDGYKKAMDALDKGDVAIFTTPCAFRWVHFEYAIKKGLNRLHGKTRYNGWFLLPQNA